MGNTEKLRAVFVTALDLPTDTDFSTVAYSVTKGWDSVAHMHLVAEVEEAFDVMLETDDILEMSSVSEATRILAAHGVEF